MTLAPEDDQFVVGLAEFTAAANTTSYSDTTVQPGQSYFYHVSASGNGGSSASSSSATATAELATEANPQIAKAKQYGVEARYGSQGNWKLGLNDDTGQDPQAQDGAFVWTSGQAEPFTFTSTPGHLATFTIGQGANQRTIQYDYDPALSVTDLCVWAQTKNAGTSAHVSDLVLDGVPVDGTISVTNGGTVFSELRILGGDLSDGWTLEGTAALTFTGTPYGSGLEFQIEAVHELPDLVAHRTGGNLGQEVSEALEDAGDPASYLILTNNDYEEPLNPNDPDDGGRDYDDLQATIPSGSSGDDDDLARITLKQINQPLAGSTIRIELSDPTAIRLFNADGSLFYDHATTGPSPLTLSAAALASGNMDLWLEGLHKNSDLSLAFTYRDSNGAEIGFDEIHASLVEMHFASADGTPVDEVSPVPVQQLLDMANGEDSATITSVAGFHVIAGGAGGTGAQLAVESGSVANEMFEDMTQTLGTDLVSKRPVILYSTGPGFVLSDSERQLVREQLAVEAIHNPDRPKVILATGPATRPRDIQYREGPGPAWARYPDADRQFDLIACCAPDIAQAWRNNAPKYETNRGSRFVEAANEDQLVVAITDRYAAINTDPAHPRKLRILILAHGSSDSGPCFGTADNPTGLLLPIDSALSEYTDADKLNDFKGALAKTKLAGVRNKLEEVMFSSCQFGASAGAERVIDAVRESLAADRVVGPRKWMIATLNRLDRTGPWVVFLAAYDGETAPDPSKPVKRTVPLGDVLYVSQVP